jgi:hypothetical protein
MKYIYVENQEYPHIWINYVEKNEKLEECFEEIQNFFSEIVITRHNPYFFEIAFKKESDNALFKLLYFDSKIFNTSFYINNKLCVNPMLDEFLYQALSSVANS